MTTLPQNNNLAYLGVRAPVPPNVTKVARAPLPTDTKGQEIGDIWVDTSANNYWGLANITAGLAVWDNLGGIGAAVATLTGDVGGPIPPAAGNITLSGGANLTTTGGGNTIVFDVDSSLTNILAVQSIAGTDLDLIMGDAAGVNVVDFLDSALVSVASLDSNGNLLTAANITSSAGNISATTGSVTAGTTVTATLGDITATNGNLVLNTAGNKIVSTSVGAGAAAGANSFGTVTLIGGNITVATSAITASSIVVLTRQTVGATGANPLGELSVGAIVPGVSFDINAWTQANATVLAVTDVSVIGWMIIN